MTRKLSRTSTTFRPTTLDIEHLFGLVSGRNRTDVLSDECPGRRDTRPPAILAIDQERRGRPGKEPSRWHSPESNRSRSRCEPIGSTDGHVRSIWAGTRHARDPPVGVREEAAAYPVITGPRTLFEVETRTPPRGCRHRSTLPTTDPGAMRPVTGCASTTEVRSSLARLDRSTSTRRTVVVPRPAERSTDWSVAGRVRRYRRPSPAAPAGPCHRSLAVAETYRVVHPAVPRPDARRLRRAARVRRARPGRRQRLGGGRQPRRRARRDGRVPLRGPAEVRPACGPARLGRDHRPVPRRPPAHARRRGLRRPTPGSPPR